MNDQRIFEEVAKLPRIRAVQLADKLDMELEDVKAQLAALVHVGDLVEGDDTAPNGMPCKVYDFSHAFKFTPVYKMLTQKATAATFGDPSMSKVDRAIAFVREKGVATSAELHALLDLKPEQTASTWLAGPLRDGRLVRDGKNWSIGTDKPAHDEALRSSSFSTLSAKHSGPMAQFSKDEPAVMPEMAAAPAATADEIKIPSFTANRVTVDRKPAGKRTAPVDLAPVAESEPAQSPSKPADAIASTLFVVPAAPVFRVGLWSDGVLETQRNGQTVATYTMEEGQTVAEFMARMREPEAA